MMAPDAALVERITQKIMEKLASPVIPIEASGRHMHLSGEAVDALFGPGYKLKKVSDLSQPGQFVCAERVRVIGPKGEFGSVVVLGPERPETQVEISSTDAMVLGVKAPVRLSGDTEGSPGIRLAGPFGEYTIPRGVVIAKRHIHMTPGDAALYGLSDKQVVSVRVEGERASTFHNVVLRVSPDFATYMHIDYDEANACGFSKGTKGIILA